MIFMMWNLFSRNLLCHLRSKEFFIWMLIFPIMLATLFYFTFSSLDQADQLQVIPIAVVEEGMPEEDSAFSDTVRSLSEKGDEQLFQTQFISEEEKARQLLKDGEIDGYIQYENGKPGLVVREDGLNQTIIKSFLDQYLQTKSSMENILQENPQLAERLPSLFSRETVTEEISLSQNAPTSKVNYFYALLAMVCMYGGMQGLNVVSFLQSNLSAIGARKTVSPAKRWKLIFADLSAGVTVQWLAIILVILFIRFILQVDFGPQLLPAFLTGIVGSLTGVSFGMLVSVPKRLKYSAKTALVVAVTMVFCFFAGLMTSGINYLVEQKAPVLAWINPAARIVDAFYCLYYYDTYYQFFLNIAVLLAMSLVMFGITIFSIRRQRHESL